MEGGKNLSVVPEEYGTDTSLNSVLAPLWHARRLIAALTILSVLIGIGATIFFSTYRSEGFFQFGGAIPMPPPKIPKEKEPGFGISLSDYKRYSAALSAAGRFNDYVRAREFDRVDGVASLRTIFTAPSGIGKFIEPVYTYTKLDAKDLMEQPKDGSNNVIGLRISYEAKKPETAERMVGLLGRYVIDTIIYITYSDSLRFKHSELTSKLTELDNTIIDLKQSLEQYRRQGAALKEIVGRYPASAEQAGRQVISVTDENARFLSPVTHLMSTEVEASQANEAILKAGRDQKQLRLMLEYYQQAKQLAEANKSGEAIMRGLEAVKTNVFKGKDMNDELVREVYNTISIDNQNATTLYLEKSRFIAGPTLPEHRTTRLSMALLVSLLGGLVLSVLIVFGRAWWATNRLRMGD